MEILNTERKENQLFPIYGISLGITDIFDIADDCNIENDGCVYTSEIKKGITIKQYCKDDFISAISFDFGYMDPPEIPNKWEDIFQLSIVISFTQIDRIIAQFENRGFSHHITANDGHGNKLFTITTPDKKYLLTWMFDADDDLDLFEVYYRCCPNCNSFDVNQVIIGETAKKIIYSCDNCGYQRNYDGISCPECASIDISEMYCDEYVCNECNCKWSIESDVVCPNCNSHISSHYDNDVLEDKYKCCHCGFQWHEDTW